MKDMQEEKKEITVRHDVGSQVIARIDELCKGGFTMPADYNYVNAIKASMLVLQDLKDKNSQPALQVCTPASVQQALFKMAIKGLDVSRNHAYFVVRGNQLTLPESYFGKALQVKRVFPNFDPTVRIIYQDDVFLYEIDPITGRRKVVKHEQKIENIDKDFVGAYMYLPCADGGTDLYMMTKRQIVAAWAKSSNKSQTVHNEFRDKMIQKTMINTGCNLIINSTPDKFVSPDENDEPSEQNTKETQDAEFEEVDMDSLPDEADVDESASAEAETEQAQVKTEDDDF
jgi:recombination protein RecT